MEEAEEQHSDALVLISRAKQALMEAKTIPEVHHMIGMAKAAVVYAKEVGAAREAIGEGVELWAEAERRLGEMLRGTEMARGTRGTLKGRDSSGGSVLVPPENDPPTLAQLGISKKQSARAQKLAAIPRDAYTTIVSRAKATGVLSVSQVLEGRKAHVQNNSGDNEWYTPKVFVEAARRVMGAIDLDPASSEQANRVVRASKYYTKDDDGLRLPWRGRVWMNPPYSKDMIGCFCERLVGFVQCGDVEDAIVLVNNGTETSWGQELFESASAVCFPKGRVKFWSPETEKGSPLQGQMVVYFGRSVDLFVQEFEEIGKVWR